MVKPKYQINKVSKNYKDCMTPDQTWLRCRPGWRSKNPMDEAKKRNDEILDALGEEVTLFTRKIRGDDIIDRLLPPVKNSFVPALPLNFIFTYEPANTKNFSDNLGGILSNFYNADLHRTADGNNNIFESGTFQPKIIAQRRGAGTSYLYIGNRKQFSNLRIHLFSRLASDNVIWEYTRGNGIWFPVPITLESDPKVNTLQESGRIVFSPTFFGNWKQDYINGEQAFWVRARIDDATEGIASAVLIYTEHIMQYTEVWNAEDNPSLFPNDKCVTIKVNGRIFNRVYDIKQLYYAEESFILIRRDQLSETCKLDTLQNPDCSLDPLDKCETDPMAHVKELGTLDLPETIRQRDLAFIYQQIMRARSRPGSNAVIVLFTINLRLDGSSITATYSNICPCTGYGRMQAPRDNQQPDDSICLQCYGTEFVNGYERFVNPDLPDGNILMSFPATAFDMPLEEHGLGKTQELTTARISFTPRIFIRDFIIRYDEFNQETGRYIVMTRTDSRGRRGVLLHQEVVIQLLDPDKIEYRILAPTLPLQPSQAQVLQSLGVLVPKDPALSVCEEYRLEKGKKDCLPTRDRRTE